VVLLVHGFSVCRERSVECAGVGGVMDSGLSGSQSVHNCSFVSASLWPPPFLSLGCPACFFLKIYFALMSDIRTRAPSALRDDVIMFCAVICVLLLLCCILYGVRRVKVREMVYYLNIFIE